MKFLHVTRSSTGELEEHYVRKTGYFCWSAVFDTKPVQYSFARGHLSEYDIIFVSMARPELQSGLMTAIRHEIGFSKSAPMLIACVDYAVQLWHQVFVPTFLRQELSYADMVFAPEPVTVDALRTILPGRDVRQIPHPVDIDRLREVQPINPDSQIPLGIFVHRYDEATYLMHLATMNLPCRSVALMQDRVMARESIPYFELMMESQPFDKYLAWAKSRQMMIDSYHFVTAWGRIQAENAVLGIPTVGTASVINQCVLWPSLTVLPGHVYQQERLLRKLLHDDMFKNEAVAFAREKVTALSFDGCKQHLLNVLDTVKRIGDQVVTINTGKEPGSGTQTDQAPPDQAASEIEKSSDSHPVSR